MALYVDGYVIVVPKKNVAAYKKMAALGKKVWMEHGALSYVETVADDISNSYGLTFAKLFKLKPTETVVFAYVSYKSKAHRNRVNKLVHQDPRMKEPPKSMPFDMKRMTMGGFKSLVVG